MSTEQIWLDFHQKLYNFILLKVKDPSIAKDIRQDVFIKIHQKINSLRDEKKIANWVYQITRNTITDHFRKNKGIVQLDDTMLDWTNENDDIQLCEKCVRPFVDKLPLKYKEALLQTELGNLSQKQYAEKIGISHSGAKSRVQRAKDQLKELFIDCCCTTINKDGTVALSNDGSDCEC